MAAKIKAVLFDLDGTLVDTAPDLLVSLNHVLAHAGRAPVSPHALDSMIGEGALKMLKAGFTHTGAPLSETEAAPMQRLFLDYYQDHCAQHSQPYPHCLETLKILNEKGLSLSVCTNKLQYLAERVIGGLGLSQWMHTIVGAWDGGPRKPDPAILQTALGRLNCSPDEAIMIGDSDKDIEAAYALAMPSVAVTYGYGPLKRGKASREISNLADLPSLLSRTC